MLELQHLFFNISSNLDILSDLWPVRFYCQLASEGIKREFTQGLFDLSNYTYEEKDGDQLVRQVKDSLGDYFRKKKVAAQVRNSKYSLSF